MTISLNLEPFFDDFDESKKYYRILFRPGYSVQARELTQMQSILQNQIKKFGDNIFQDGTVVLNGQTFFENSVSSLKLQTPVVGEISILTQYLTQTVVGVTSGTKASVKLVAQAVNNDPNTIFVKVISGSGFVDGESLTFLNSTTVVGRLTVAASVNPSMIFSVNKGVFYVGGEFVLNDAQSIVVEKYSNNTTKSIGFTVVESFIDSDADPSLLDNAQNTPNFAAPGAQRYFIDLVLTAVDVASIPVNFVEIARITNGVLVTNKKVTTYSAIGDEIARRTYDQSGDFTVRPFPLLLKDNIPTARGTTTITGGVVTSVVIASGGFGYKSAPTVTITGDGTGATAVAVIDTNPVSATFGQVTSVTITAGGSGYTTATVAISGDPNQFTASLDPGKAYVKGYEFETISQTNLSIDRARTTDQANNIDTVLSFGNFVYVNSLLNVFNTSAFDTVEIHNVVRTSITGATSLIGTANVRFIKWVSGTVGTANAIYKLSLFNIVMTAGLFKDVEGIVIRSGATVLTGVNVDLLSKVGGIVTNDVFLSGADSPTLVFPMNNQYIKTIRDVSNLIQSDYTTSRVFPNIAFNSGTATIATLNGNERFFGGAGLYSDTIKDQYFIVTVTAVGTSAFTVGQILRFDTGSGRSITGGAVAVGSTHQLNFNANSATNFTATIIATINENQVGEKTKALQGYTYRIISNPSTVVGNKDPILISDVFNLLAVYNTGNTNPTGLITVDPTTGNVTWGNVATHNNVTGDYALDNGQRDEFYDNGNIVVTRNVPANTNFLVAVFNYFTHSGAGYFSVDSYSIPYTTIPTYKSPATGKNYILRDSIDFRPRKADGGTTFNNAQIPDPDFTFNTSYQYYLPRIDIIYATKDKQILSKQGIPNLLPKVPRDESNSMRLYILSIPPYTATLSDISVKFIENKRYTMRDIGKLETRIENLEYYTQLTLLEKQAKDDSVPDGSNLQKFKNGFLVDPFTSHKVGDVKNPDYLCSVTPSVGQLRAYNDISFTNFTFGTFSGTQQSGPIGLLQYTESVAIEQKFATSSVNVNPFNVVDFFGTIKLEPSQDIWFNITNLPPLNRYIDNNVTGADSYIDAGQLTFANRTVFVGSVPQQTITTAQPAWGFGQNQTVAANQRGWLGFGENTSFFNPPPSGAQYKTERVITSRLLSQTSETNLVINNSSVQDNGTTIANGALQTYIRSSTIIGVARDFKPLYRLYPFIDDTNISQYSRPVAVITIQNLVGNVFDSTTGVYEIVSFKTGGVGGATTATAKTAFVSPPTSADSTKRLLSVFSLNALPVVGQTVVGTGGSYASVTNVTTYNLNDPIVPDEYGIICYEINIPDATFKTGTRTVRLVDNLDNNLANATSSGEAKYFAQGQNQTKQENLVTTRTITTNRVITRVWHDPVAESFMIDPTIYPEGMHVSSVDIFFQTKSTSVAVSVELRRMVNGTPESRQTIPFASVTLFPEKVNTSLDGTVATNFKFDTPVHLVAGEYAVVVQANCLDYNVFIGEINKKVINSNSYVTQQPYNGVLFKSQNASTWSPEQLQDLKFRINRAVFNSTGTITLLANDTIAVPITGTVTAASPVITSSVSQTAYYGIAVGMLAVGTNIPANTTIISINIPAATITLSNNATAAASGTINFYPIPQFTQMQFKGEVATPTNTSVVWSVQTLNRDTNLMDSSFVNFENTNNYNFPNVKKLVPASQNGNGASLIIKATLTTLKNNVSPFIDIARIGAALIKPYINNDTTGETNPRGGNAYARYITRQVTLKTGFDASNIVVTFDGYKPSGTNFAVYYKILPSELTTPIDDQPWVQMIINPVVPFSSDTSDIKEHKYYAPNAFGAYNVPTNYPISPRFNNFKIKVVLLSTDETLTPRVSNFRTIALDR